MIDVVCYYADFGKPYQPLLERMAASAKRHIECRTVILTPTPQPWMKVAFDAVEVPQSTSYPRVTRDNLCQQRAEAMMSWAALAKRQAYFVDPDLEFRATPQIPEADVCLLWRPKKLAMPYNTGFIAAKPGCADFWMAYGNTVVNLPTRIHGWWCDQLGFSILLGNQRQAGESLVCHGAHVYLLNSADHCDVPKAVTESAWGIHYKGKLKGPGWGDIYAQEVFKDDFAAQELAHLRVA